MSAQAQREWAKRVLKQMTDKLPMNEISRVFFHAGLSYRKPLVGMLQDQGIQCLAPLEGLSLGKQKAWYLEHK